jgi:hypothetical protein
MRFRSASPRSGSPSGSSFSGFFAMPKYVSPFHLPDEHMRLVGIIAAHWEVFDVILQKSVAEVMSLKFDDVTMLTEGLSATAKFDIILGHARQLPKDEWKRFEKAITRTKKAYSARNAYVHSKWVVEAGEPLPKRVSLRTRGGKIVKVDEAVEISELERTAQEIHDAGEQFTLLFQEYGLLKS